MAGKKLGFFKKFIGNVGRRLYFRTSKKFRLGTLNLLYRALVEYLAEINDNNIQSAIKVLEEQLVSPEASNILYELMSKKIAGYSFESFMTQDLMDMEYLTPFFLYAVFGPYSKELFGKPRMGVTEDGVTYMRLPLKKCFMCSFESKIVPESLGEKDYGGGLPVILKIVNENLMEFAYGENPYRVVVKETMCRVRGDPEGEVTAWFYEIDK